MGKKIPTFARANPFAPRQYGELVKVSDRVYIFRNIVNTSILIGDNGCAVVDTQVNSAMARKVLAHIRDLTDKPLLYAVNTHYHWDHTNGNSVFKEAGATIVGRNQTLDFMVNRAPRQKGFLASRGFPLGDDPVLPELTFETSHELDLGGLPMHLKCLGAAETEDATAIHLPAENMVISGDTVMTGSFPIFGQPVMNEGLMDEHSWIDTIGEIQKFQPDHILPGHGPIAQETEIKLLIDIEQYFIDEVGKRHEQGMSLLDIIDEIEKSLPDWIAHIPEVWGTPRYAILRVYRGLIEDDEPGWMYLKPSAIQSAEPDTVKSKSDALKELADFVSAADEAGEGGDHGLAIALLREATSRFSEDPSGYVALGDALLKGTREVSSVLEKGDFFIEARTAAQRALEVDGNYAPAHLFEGQDPIMMAYRNGDDVDNGVAAVRKALECGLDEKGQAQAHFYLGMAARTEGRESEAKAEFGQALEFDPTYMQAVMAMRA